MATNPGIMVDSFYIMISNKKVQLSVLVALVASVALTGCSVGISPTADAAQTTQSTAQTEKTAPDTGDDAAVEEEPETEQPADEEEPETDEGDMPTRPTREEFLPMVTSELTCPDGALAIEGIGVYNIADDCDAITITGNGSVVLVQNVGSLQIDAIGVVVLAAEADSITLSDQSNGSYVSWETGAPDIDDSSIGSVLVSAAE